MAVTKTINFSVATLEKLPIPMKGYDTYKDARNIYLQLYVTNHGIKTFFVRKRFCGRDTRVIIGRFPIIAIEEARKRALFYLAMLSDGKHPHEEKRKQTANRKTFGEHFEEYMERHSKKHKKTWADDEREVKRCLSHWFKRDLSDIKKPEVQRLHEKIGEENGNCQANKMLVRVRAIYNKAIEWGWEGTNPANKIKKFKERSRERFVQPEEMPFVIQALNDIPCETRRDYFSMLFLTGARKTNVSTMQWTDINWEQSIWRIPDTKNGEPVIVPLIPRAMDILRRRFSQTKSKWVFPRAEDKTNYISNQTFTWKEALVRATLYKWRAHEISAAWMQQAESDMKYWLDNASKLDVIIRRAAKENKTLPSTLLDIHLHDIRRTFASYQAMTGASLITIGKSLGHKSPESTKVYARLNIDTVRASIEKAAEAMFD